MTNSPTSAPKTWAREHYRGVENFTLPSFTPAYELDEAGIRRDVRQSIEHGFFSTACVATLSTFEQYKRMLEVACEEAAGRILVGAYVGEKTVEANIELLRHAKKVGCSHAVVVPRVLHPKDDSDIYGWHRELIDAVDLPVVLYAQYNPRVLHIHPSGMSVNAFSQLADLPSVIAIKLTQAMNLVRAKECADAFGHKILIGPVHLDMVPLLTKHCHIQWSGQWNAECAQSPQKPYVVDFMEAVASGDLAKAYPLYWAMEPAYRGYFNLQSPLLLRGVHPWSVLKFHQWCVGGNGGLVRDNHEPGHTPDLTNQDRQRITDNYRKAAIPVTDAPIEEFVVGAEAYARGVRRKDLASLPLYED